MPGHRCAGRDPDTGAGSVADAVRTAAPDARATGDDPWHAPAGSGPLSRPGRSLVIVLA